MKYINMLMKHHGIIKESVNLLYENIVTANWSNTEKSLNAIEMKSILNIDNTDNIENSTNDLYAKVISVLDSLGNALKTDIESYNAELREYYELNNKSKSTLDDNNIDKHQQKKVSYPSDSIFRKLSNIFTINPIYNGSGILQSWDNTNITIKKDIQTSIENQCENDVKGYHKDRFYYYPVNVIEYIQNLFDLTNEYVNNEQKDKAKSTATDDALIKNKYNKSQMSDKDFVNEAKSYVINIINKLNELDSINSSKDDSDYTKFKDNILSELNKILTYETTKDENGKITDIAINFKDDKTEKKIVRRQNENGEWKAHVENVKEPLTKDDIYMDLQQIKKQVDNYNSKDALNFKDEKGNTIFSIEIRNANTLKLLRACENGKKSLLDNVLNDNNIKSQILDLYIDSQSELPFLILLAFIKNTEDDDVTSKSKVDLLMKWLDEYGMPRNNKDENGVVTNPGLVELLKLFKYTSLKSINDLLAYKHNDDNDKTTEKTSMDSTITKLINANFADGICKWYEVGAALDKEIEEQNKKTNDENKTNIDNKVSDNTSNNTEPSSNDDSEKKGILSEINNNLNNSKEVRNLDEMDKKRLLYYFDNFDIDILNSILDIMKNNPEKYEQDLYTDIGDDGLDDLLIELGLISGM